MIGSTLHNCRFLGAGALARPDPGGLLFAGAISLGLCAVAPFGAGAALKAARET